MICATHNLLDFFGELDSEEQAVAISVQTVAAVAAGLLGTFDVSMRRTTWVSIVSMCACDAYREV